MISESGLTSLPRQYHNVNSLKPRGYWDYDIFSVNWGCQDSYGVCRKLGHGRYGEVYQGIKISSGEKIVVKIMKPVQRRRLKREISILQNLRNGTNIVQLLDVVRDPTSKTPSLVFEFINSVDPADLFPRFTACDVRHYVLELLKALDFCHSCGIMHRDVKPENIVYDPVQRKLRLIDWGLAEFYHAGREYNVRVASRYFKGPELLVGFQRYDYSLDIWSTGCILASMVFRKEPFFAGRDNNHQLQVIAGLLGVDDLRAYCQKYGVEPGFRVKAGSSRGSFEKFITSENRFLADPEVISLIESMMVYDHAARILPSEAMQHRCFSSPVVGPGNEEFGDEQEVFFLDDTDTEPMLSNV
eukprot:TRINITY_DN56397_c0_g1_i1.p1 TRINITY_DN56397_c0_g1~~TRINITY_DN56397_c0_g1_i1.p1  ORF type:complete len:357 (+),score=46.97 TRINITY_DN56397_c0_g1_i1:53-1123(+)